MSIYAAPAAGLTQEQVAAEATSAAELAAALAPLATAAAVAAIPAAPSVAEIAAEVPTLAAITAAIQANAGGAQTGEVREFLSTAVPAGWTNLEPVNAAFGPWAWVPLSDDQRAAWTTTALTGAAGSRIYMHPNNGVGHYFDTATPENGWVTFAAKPNAGHTAYAAVAAVGADLFTFGTDTSGTFYAFVYKLNGTTLAWTTEPTTGFSARGRCSATTLPDNTILWSGGLASGGKLDSCGIYSPTAGTHTATGSLTVARQDHATVTMPDGDVLAIGGLGVSGALSSIERWSSTAGTWSVEPYALDTPLYLIGNSVVPVADGVLIFGGYNGTAHTNAVRKLLYADGSVSIVGYMPAPRTQCRAHELADGRIAVHGGTGTYLANSSTLALANTYTTPATIVKAKKD